MKAIFKNDNNVEIILPEHEKSAEFSNRDNHEVLFRRICTWLINSKLIDGNIIDLGAWMGDNAIPWAKNISNTVYAIDPSPNNCDFIRIVCELNNIGNISIIQTAISDKIEVLTTYENIDHCSFLNEGDTKVFAVTLNELHSQDLIKDVGFVHLDVEDMEFKVLNGMTTIIDKYHPIITYEQHIYKNTISEIADFLKARNYNVYLINETLPNCNPDCRNFISFPNESKYKTVIKDMSKYFNLNGLFTQF